MDITDIRFLKPHIRTIRPIRVRYITSCRHSPLINDQYHLAGGVPAGLHHTSAHAAAQGSLLDDLRLSQGDVQLRTHHVAIDGRTILLKQQFLLYSFYFQCHNCK